MGNFLGRAPIILARNRLRYAGGNVTGMKASIPKILEITFMPRR